MTRRLALRLLAPTILLCFLPVAACLFGALYLNHLHINASEVLSENVRSTQTAAGLETTAKELVRLLRGSEPRSEAFVAQIEEQNRQARASLVEAEALANLEREGVLVRQIAAGIHEYLRRWDHLAQVPAEQRREYETALADYIDARVLAPCVELRKFNMNQVEQSDRENLLVVSRVRWALFLVGFAGPIGGLVLGYRVARRLSLSIYQLSVRIRDAAGRLNRELGSVTLEETGDLPELHRQMQGIIDEIGRVIAQLQQREHEVLRAEQLAAVGQIAAGVAHELRNPLTAVKMLVQTALEDVPPGSSLLEDLRVMEREIRRVEHYLQLFLDFARPPQLERRRTDLREVAQQALALLDGRARRQEVFLEADFPPGPVLLHIDPGQVHQVIVNLLLNALDALPHEGTIRLTIRPAPEVTELLVQDSGPGIPSVVLDRMFEPFVSGKETGVGLGLSICKRLVEAQGGTIRGSNGPDGGAVFTLRFPQGGS